MRLTSFGIVLVLITSFLAVQANAQIPERVLFQPGSYAFGPYYSAGISQSIALPTSTALAEETTETENTENSESDAEEENQTEWETAFGVETPLQEPEKQADSIEVGVSASSNPATVPYLAYHRNPLTHRIHVVPYQPGYAAEPEAFPEHQSKLNLLLSTLPSREQNRPQVKYASYYDPDPVIITDKPSRLQLILGYPNASWTSCCENRWGHRLAQCPGVEPVALGPYAEMSIKDQPVISDHSGIFTGIFSGQRQLNYAQHAQPIPLPPYWGVKQSPFSITPPYPNYSREELRRIIEQRVSYARATAVPIPQPIPDPPSAGYATLLPSPPKELQSKTSQSLPPFADNQADKGCKDCKKHVGSCQCQSSSCKSCAVSKTALRSLKTKKTACGTETKEKVNKTKKQPLNN
ncbi:MAG: hypothetical protein LBG58_03670 [Planctomycetaceae bacterium]|jgi:hypothetical protein|nr:hypothetical protein [Planctomycetaceae bacterium]